MQVGKEGIHCCADWRGRTTFGANCGHFRLDLWRSMLPSFLSPQLHISHSRGHLGENFSFSNFFSPFIMLFYFFPTNP